MDYSFLPYNSIFPELFKKEKSYLQRILGNNITIEHFGSTSVPGLGGKGVIDIYILTSKDKIKSTSDILQKNGYVFSDFFKDDDHLLHQINKLENNKKYHYHIHLSSLGNNNFKDCIIFRDYLRTHPEAVKKYTQLKKIALNKIKDITDKKEVIKIYLDTKKPIIEEIIQSVKKS